MMVKLNLLGRTSQPAASNESSKEMAVAPPVGTTAVIPPSPTQAPSPVAIAVATAQVSKPTGLGAFLKSARSGNPLPVPTPAPTPVPEPAQPLNKVPVVSSTGPMGFDQKLRQLDALIGEVMRIPQTDLDHTRNYVAEIMTELKIHPEYEGMVRASDIRNLMKFVQSSSSQATNQFAKAAESKEKKATAKRKAASMDLGAFSEDLSDSQPKLAAPTRKMDLKALAGFNTDDVKTK